MKQKEGSAPEKSEADFFFGILRTEPAPEPGAYYRIVLLRQLPSSLRGRSSYPGRPKVCPGAAGEPQEGER